MFLTTAVHTTGVNWAGVLAVTASITIIMTAFAGIILRSMKTAIRAEISSVIAVEVTPVLVRIEAELRQHDTRIARLEGVEEGRRMAVAAAGVSTSK